MNWFTFLKKIKNENPRLTYKEILLLASKEWKNLSQKRFKYLEFPMSIYYYVINLPNGQTKKIILLGEIHSPPSDFSQHTPTINAAEFIAKLTEECSKKNKCVDFFLEEWFKPGQGYEQIGYDKEIAEEFYNDLNKEITTLDYEKNNELYKIATIQILRRVFVSCETSGYLKKNKCKVLGKELQNLRKHNFDLRFNDVTGKYFLEYFIFLLNSFDLEGNIEFYKYVLGFKDQDIKKLIKNNKEKTTVRFYSEIKKIREKIIKSYEKFLKDSKETLPAGKKELREMYLEVMIKSYNTSKERKFVEDLLFMTDLYVLSRMFRNFELKNRGPKSCIDKKHLNNIICYAGNAHIENYNHFIKYYYPESLVYKAVTKNVKSKLLDFDKDTVVNTKNFTDFRGIISDFC